MSEYKQCPNGHYYQGDHCPYCPNPKNSLKQPFPHELKVCNNLHAYNADLDYCPVCDSPIVVDRFTRKGSDTILYKYIHLMEPVKVRMGELELSKCKYIRVELPRGYKHFFFFSTNNIPTYEEIEVVPDREIQFGTTSMCGRDFIRLCDLLLENRLYAKNDTTEVEVNPDDLIQLFALLKRVKGEPYGIQKTKFLAYGHNVFTPFPDSDGVPVYHINVCSNGHGYDVSLQSCPFCGSEVVVSKTEARGGFTLAIAHLLYEKDGAPITCHDADVDGNTLTGELCMSIEYSGAFKYAYFVGQNRVLGESLPVNPQSQVTLRGDGFSETFSGRDFYKMCDMLFEKYEKENK